MSETNPDAKYYSSDEEVELKEGEKKPKTVKKLFDKDTRVQIRKNITCLAKGNIKKNTLKGYFNNIASVYDHLHLNPFEEIPGNADEIAATLSKAILDLKTPKQPYVNSVVRKVLAYNDQIKKIKNPDILFDDENFKEYIKKNYLAQLLQYQKENNIEHDTHQNKKIKIVDEENDDEDELSVLSEPNEEEDKIELKRKNKKNKNT